MKKFLSLILAVMMLLGCSAALADYTPGAYTATTVGMGGEFTVTFDADKMISIEVGENKETAGLGTIPLEQLPAKIIEAQSVGIEAISDATISSDALLAAVLDCVVQAGGDAEVWTAEVKAVIHAKYQGTENVILLEKMAFCGGSTALSGSTMTRPAIEGDPEGTMTSEEMYDYYMTMASAQVEPDILHLYIDNSPDVWRWFTSLEGGEVTHMFHNTPENVFTIYPDGQGQGVINTLDQEVFNHGVDIRLNHDVTSILTDEYGTVVGVKCTNTDCAEQNVYANLVNSKPVALLFIPLEHPVKDK